MLALSETYSNQSIYRQTGLQMVEASMSLAAMATVNAKEVDNRRFQEQFEPYFKMLLLMEEMLLERYASTRALLSAE